MRNENVAVPRRQKKNPKYRMRVVGDHAARNTPRMNIVYSANTYEVVNCARSATIIGEAPGWIMRCVSASTSVSYGLRLGYTNLPL